MVTHAMMASAAASSTDSLLNQRGTGVDGSTGSDTGTCVPSPQPPPSSSKRTHHRRRRNRRASATNDSTTAAAMVASTTPPPPPPVSSNELTRLIPGYTAPLTLCTTTSSFSSFSSSTTNTTTTTTMVTQLANLNALARHALHTEISKQQTSATRTSETAAVSFKTGRSLPSNSNNSNSNSNSNNNAGRQWFHMASTPMTDTLRYDLAVIRNRNVLDPKRFYKKLDRNNNSSKSVIQLGTVVEGASEYYSSRLTRAQQRPTVMEEYMANGDAVYATKKYTRLQREKTLVQHTTTKQQQGSNSSNKKRKQR